MVLVEGRIVAASENPVEEYREIRKRYSGRRVVLTYIPTEESLINLKGLH